MIQFITFEGCEGSGKTTQIELLKQYLQSLGMEVITTREPGGTEFSEKIRQLILGGNGISDSITETMLLNVARRDHVTQKISPALKEGKVVICDRFYDSTLVYQGLVKGVALESLEMLNALATDTLTPDITFILDIAPEESLKRITNNRDNNNYYDLQPLEFHQKIRDGFIKIAENHPQRVIIINASGSISDIHANIVKKLNFKN